LYPILDHDNPDDAFSKVPYNKGYIFLSYLESLVGQDLFE
jgi:leukotriene-A4 hydrolase